MRIGFANRIEAGRLLSVILARYPRQESVILTPMNGSVIVGKIVSLATGISLDVLPVLPVHHPLEWDTCIGAVSQDDLVLSEGTDSRSAIVSDLTWLMRQRLSEQMALFKKGKPSLSLKGKTVIVVTEGIRTAAKLLPSIQLTARMSPCRIVAAAPIVAPDAARALATVVAEIRSLYTPLPYAETKAFYREFQPRTENELARIFAGADPIL